MCPLVAGLITIRAERQQPVTGTTADQGRGVDLDLIDLGLGGGGQEVGQTAG